MFEIRAKKFKKSINEFFKDIWVKLNFKKILKNKKKL